MYTKESCVPAMPSPVCLVQCGAPRLCRLTWHRARWRPADAPHWRWRQHSVSTQDLGSSATVLHDPCHSSDGKMKIELRSSDPKWTLRHYHNKLKIPNLVMSQWQAKRKLKRMKAHTIIQRTYDSSLYASRDKACILGGPLVMFLIVETNEALLSSLACIETKQ